MELEPLTSICGQTESQFSTGAKGTLCRMQKVTSDEHWPDEESSAQQPSGERRISAGFPLLTKLKTLTDKHQQQQQQQQQRYKVVPSSHHRAAPPTIGTGVPSSDATATDERVEPEPLGAGLPLLQRLLLLKKKEDAEKRSAAVIVTTAADTVAVSSDCATTTLPSSEFAAVVSEMPKKAKNCKKEVAFAEEVLVGGSPATVDARGCASGKGGVGAGRKRELPRPWSLLRKTTVDRRRDDGVARPPSDEPTAGWRRLNPHRTLSRLYGSVAARSPDEENAASRAGQPDATTKRTRTGPVERARRPIFDGRGEAGGVVVVVEDCDDHVERRSRGKCATIEDVDDDDDDEGKTYAADADVEDRPPEDARVVDNAASRTSKGALSTTNRRHCRYRSVDDLLPAEYSRPSAAAGESTSPYGSQDVAGATRSCSLDSCAARRDDGVDFAPDWGSERAATRQPAGSRLSDATASLERASPGSCETLERRELKSILKRVSLGGRRVRDILTRPSASARNGDRRRCASMRGHFELLRRLMRAPTIEGYVARRSTLEKSVAYDTTVGSPPPTRVPSTTLFFSDYGGDEDDDDDDAEGTHVAQPTSRKRSSVVELGPLSRASSDSSHSAASMVDATSVRGHVADDDDDADDGGGSSEESSDYDLVRSSSYRRRPSVSRRRRGGRGFSPHPDCHPSRAAPFLSGRPLSNRDGRCLQDAETRIRDIEYQVREKDELIRTLRWKIAELRVSLATFVRFVSRVASFHSSRTPSATRLITLCSGRGRSTDRRF